jgi:hypothetical protein
MRFELLFDDDAGAVALTDKTDDRFSVELRGAGAGSSIEVMHHGARGGMGRFAEGTRHSGTAMDLRIKVLRNEPKLATQCCAEKGSRQRRKAYHSQVVFILEPQLAVMTIVLVVRLILHVFVCPVLCAEFELTGLTGDRGRPVSGGVHMVIGALLGLEFLGAHLAWHCWRPVSSSRHVLRRGFVGKK